jgi:hypothetical protein
MEARLKETEATDLEVNPEETRSVSKHQDVPKEEAVVKTIGALENQYGDRHLAIGRGRQPKKGPRARVGPVRSSPPPADGWPAVPFLHRATKAQRSVNKKRRHACSSFRTNSFKKGVMGHVDSLLENNRETNRQRPLLGNGP